MAISLSNAKAGMNAFRGLNGTSLFQAMKETGGYLFKKHTTKATALEAAQSDHETKGYVKKLVTKQVENLAAYKDLPDRERRHVTGLTAAKPQSKHFGGGKVISSTMTKALGEADYADLLMRVVRTDGGSFYRAGVDVEKRFLYVIAIPEGYVGRSIDEHENKTKGLTLMVLIVIAPAGGNPFLMNMFPADTGYVANKSTLV